MKKSVVYVVALFLIGGLGAVAGAISWQGDTEPSSANTDLRSNESKTSLEVRAVGRDADGAIRGPSSSERRQFERELKKAMKKFKKETAQVGPEGTVSLVVAPHYLNFSVAHRGGDGDVRQDCVNDLEGLEQLTRASTQDNSADHRPVQ